MLRVVKAAISANKEDKGYSPSMRVAYLSEYLIDDCGISAEDLLNMVYKKLESSECVDALEDIAKDLDIDLSEVHF